MRTPARIILFTLGLALMPLSAQTVTLLADNNDGHDDIWVKRYQDGKQSWGIVGNHTVTWGSIWWNSFPGADGVYHVTLGAVLEPDGNSPYKLYADDVKIAEGEYPFSTGTMDCNSSFYKSQALDLGNREIKQGQKIRLWASSMYPCGSDHGQYCRFYEIKFTPTTEPADPLPADESSRKVMDRYWVEKDGLVVVEAENTGSSLGEWKKHTGTGTYSYLKGFLGDGCIQFTGNGQCTGAPNSILRYYVKIATPGRYKLHMRALEENIQSKHDCANDCYVACPSQTQKLSGQTGCEDKLTKFVSWKNGGIWTWDLKFECGHHNFSDAEYEFGTPGVYEFQIAGRSKDFFVDRFTLATVGHAGARDNSRPESQIVQGTSFILVKSNGTDQSNADPTVIVEPAAGSVLGMGSTITLKGTGTGLAWYYDANSDGKGRIAIGSGAEVSFTVPTGIADPRELTLILTGGGGK